jgi:PhzF family phenazine biosynthesis protein
MQPILVVDAFSDRPFAGNPAAVCLLREDADPRWMQNVAMEMNLAETSFVLPRRDRFGLRWFTPTIEVDLCGHATLAAAHVLWETGVLGTSDEARFDTRSGELGARRDGEWIELDFPATPVQAADPPRELIESLGPAVRNRVRAVAKSKFDFLVELDVDQNELAALKPDLQLLARVPARGTILTTHRTAEARFDFASRFFAPACGINEDPVTGSSHCALGPWWGDRLEKDEMLAFQASPRGGVVRVKMRGDRVLLGGQAVTVLRASLL